MVFDRAAETYGQLGSDFFSDLGVRLVQRLRLSPGAWVLDVGAGTGAATIPAVRQVGPQGRVTAIDVSLPMLLQLTKRVPLDCQGVSISVMDAGRLGVRDGSQDAVISSLVLTSVSDPAGAIGEMVRVLRPEGRIALAVSPGWWWQEDADWDWHAELVADLGVTVETAPSAGARILHDLLVDAPLTDLELVEETFTIAWSSVQQFWDWCWSHGWRSVLEGLSAYHLNTYETRVWRTVGQTSHITGRVAAMSVTATRLSDG